MRRCKRESVNGCRILDLPLDLVYNIICRLTVVSIFSCKCVCKTLLEILTDRRFVEFHLTKASDIHDGLILHDRFNVSKLLLLYNNKIELEKPHSDYANFDSCPWQMLAVPDILSTVYNCSSFIIGACNGLLCMRYMNEKLCYIYYICNPILGECFALPHIRCCPIEISGFGYCPKTKQYKVIRFMSPEICMIYTLGRSRCWRKIGYAPYPRSVSTFVSSLNGNLHWIAADASVSNLICCFNLETEQCSHISPPAQFNQEISGQCDVQLGSLGGLLCFSYVVGYQFQAFVMKGYGVKGYWIERCSIDLWPITISLGCSIVKVINILNNGDLILYSNVHSLLFHNPRKGTTRFMLAEKALCEGIIAFVPSFVSLKDIVVDAGGSVEVVRRKMGHNLWSDKGYRFSS